MHFLRNTSIVVCIVLIALAGCGGGGGGEKVKMPDVSPAAGVVTYNDKPVAGASVQFVSPNTKQNGWACGAGTDAAGKFEIETVVSGTRAKGVPPGEYTVIVTKVEAMDSAKMKELEEAAKSQTGPNVDSSKMPSPSKSEIPVKYATDSGSGLKVTIDKAGNKNIELKLAD